MKLGVDPAPLLTPPVSRLNTIILKWQFNYKKLATLGIVALIAGYLFKTYRARLNTYYLNQVTFPQYQRLRMKTNKTKLIIFKGDSITDDHASELTEFFNNLNSNQAVDFILDTTGGDLSATVIIQNIMKIHKGPIHVFVPMKALSGGTILSLSTKHLWTNTHTQFGPMDSIYFLSSISRYLKPNL